MCSIAFINVLWLFLYEKNNNDRFLFWFCVNGFRLMRLSSDSPDKLTHKLLLLLEKGCNLRRDAICKTHKSMLRISIANTTWIKNVNETVPFQLFQLCSVVQVFLSRQNSDFYQFCL